MSSIPQNYCDENELIDCVQRFFSRLCHFIKNESPRNVVFISISGRFGVCQVFCVSFLEKILWGGEPPRL